MSFFLLFTLPFDSTNPDTDMIPTGAILPFAGISAPSGYVFCYGQSLDRTANAPLFASIGTIYGSVDANSFNVPDLRGRIPAGKDDMGGIQADRMTGNSGTLDGKILGNGGGNETHQLTVGEMPSHVHGFANGDASFDPGTTYTVSVKGGVSSETAPAGFDGFHNNIQPTLIVNYIIKL